MGAPESTAAATLSPGSLPSITRFGIGEKLLSDLSGMPVGSCWIMHLRGAIVNSHVVVGLVTHGVRSTFLSVLGRLGEGCIGGFAGAGLGRDFVRGVIGSKCAVFGSNGPHRRRTDGSGQ